MTDETLKVKIMHARRWGNRHNSLELTIDFEKDSFSVGFIEGYTIDQTINSLKELIKTMENYKNGK